jgi:hypothetical protein
LIDSAGRVFPRALLMLCSRLRSAMARGTKTLYDEPANPIGRCVKLADLHDNSDLSRIAAPSERDFQRIEKYRRAIDLINRLPTCSDEPANAFASTVIADEQ